MLSLFVTSMMIGINSCRDEFDEEEALRLEHEFLRSQQLAADEARRASFADSVAAAQAALRIAEEQKRATLMLEAQLQKTRDSLFNLGGVINYAVNVVYGNTTTFSGAASNGRMEGTMETVEGAVVTIYHETLGQVQTVTTGPSGIASFPGLRIGKVTGNIILEGHTPVNFVADITPSTSFQRPAGVITNADGTITGDPASYTRTAGTLVPVFELPVDGIAANKISTIQGRATIETDLTNFAREIVPEGTMISASIDGNRPEFLQVINRAAMNTFGDGPSGGVGSGVNGGTNGQSDDAEGDGRLVQLAYTGATFTAMTDAAGDYSLVVPAFPTGNGLPMDIRYSDVVADQTLYDVVRRVHNEQGTQGQTGDGSGTPVFEVVTKRTVFPAPSLGSDYVNNGTTNPGLTTIPEVDAVDVSVAPPYAVVNGTGASGFAYLTDSDGGISEVVVSNGGHGYIAAPLVYIPHPNENQGNLTEGDWVDIVNTLEDPNNPYRDDRARATATVSPEGVVTGVTVTYAGQGYYTEDANGNPQPVPVYFIPRGFVNEGSFGITVGRGGCIAAGTTVSINGGFTQLPTITDNQTPVTAADYTAAVANGVLTITFPAEKCGLAPGATVTFTATSKVTRMLKLRPVISIEGGSIAALTIADGQYAPLNGNSASITGDPAFGGADVTNEDVLNGLYSQAPTIKISGTGSGATATTVLNAQGQVSQVNVTNGGTGYDRPNTTIRVESSVQTRAAYIGKFVPADGSSTVGGNAAQRTITVTQGGRFYTQDQFNAFNANNAATTPPLVALDAIYNGTMAVAPTASSSTSLFATPAGTPLNVLYSTAADTDPNINFTTADTNIDETANPTPGINFANGGQGYSEDATITIQAVDANKTANTSNAEFDYQLGDGYVTNVALGTTFNLTPGAGPLALVLGSNTTGTAGEPYAYAVPLVNVLTPTGSPATPTGASNYTQGQVAFGVASGDGIATITPPAGSNGGRFAQTPELNHTGPGTGFEYVVNMAFEHAIQPTLEDISTNGGITFRIPATAVNGTALTAVLAAAINDPSGAAGDLQQNLVTPLVAEFVDNQQRLGNGVTVTGGNPPTIPARFQANMTVGLLQADATQLAADEAALDAGGILSSTTFVTFNIVPNSFAPTGTPSGGQGYDAANILTPLLAIRRMEAAGASYTMPALGALSGTGVAAGTVRPVLLLNDNDAATPAQRDQINTTVADTNDPELAEGLANLTLGGRLLSVQAVPGRSGSGYGAGDVFSLVATGYSESVPAASNVPGGLEVSFTTGGAVSTTILASGNGFPYYRDANGVKIPNKNYVRLLKGGLDANNNGEIEAIELDANSDGWVDADKLVPVTDVQSITVVRRFQYIRLAALTQTTDGNGLSATGTTGLNFGDTRVLTAGVTTTKGTTAATGTVVSYADYDGNGQVSAGDRWVLAGDGYSENVTVSISAQTFSGGATPDPASIQVRSSGLRIGTVRINNDMVHPIIAMRDPANPVQSINYAPDFRFTFGTPAGTPTFGTTLRAGDNNGRQDIVENYTTGTIVTGQYNHLIPTTTKAYRLEEVQITSGGANYTAAPFFRVIPKNILNGATRTAVDQSASGTAALAGNAVASVTLTDKGAYRVGPNAIGGTDAAKALDALPFVIVNDYIRKLFLQEEGTGNERLRLRGIGNITSVIVDDQGAGYDFSNGVANLLVVSKGADFNDKNNDGLFQSGEHADGFTPATITINAGATAGALTSADFTIVGGEGYTQDPDIVVWTHNNEFVAAPRRDENPIYFERLSQGSGLTGSGFRAFEVDNNAATNFREVAIDLSGATTAAGTIPGLGAGGSNSVTANITPANLEKSLTFSFAGTSAKATETNQGTITGITWTQNGVTGGNSYGLPDGTFPLLITGGGPNASGAQATVTVADGIIQSVALVSGGTNYDHDYPDYVVQTPGGAMTVTGGIQVQFPRGAGASAEAMWTPFTIDKVEMLHAGVGYADEPIQVRVVPDPSDLNDVPAAALATLQAGGLLTAGATATSDAAKVAYFMWDPIAAFDGVEARVASVTHDAATGGITGVTIDPNNRGAGYNTNAMVMIETFKDVLMREAYRIYLDGNYDEQFPTYNFDAFVTASVAIDVENGAITAARVVNPGFGYIALPEIRVNGTGSGAVLAATGINFLDGTAGQQTGTGDYFNFNSYFLGGAQVPAINFADHRVGGMNITAGGTGYNGGNFPGEAQGFTSTIRELQINILGGVTTVNDLYYGTGIRDNDGTYAQGNN